MQCIHGVKVKPIFTKDGYITVKPYHVWLNSNNIKRFRGGLLSRIGYSEFDVLFRFENKEDAMAFKLRWI